MPLEPALKAMLVDTVAHAAYTGQDAYGKPTHAAPVNRPARIEYQVSAVATPAGQARTSTTVVFFDSDVPIGLKDKLTLPDGSEPAIQEIQSPRHAEAPARIHHHKVVL